MGVVRNLNNISFYNDHDDQLLLVSKTCLANDLPKITDKEYCPLQIIN